MQTVHRLPQSTPNPIQPPVFNDAAVRATLGLILQSQPFRTSRQCQNLLRYIVEHSLHDDDASLRERILGIEVFGRSPDYDTSEDPVVRMRAADVRKRLAQFYQSSEQLSPGVFIELKPGSYRATFHEGHELKDSEPSEAASEGLVPSDAPVLTTIGSALPALREQSQHRGIRTRSAFVSVLLALMLGYGGWRIWMARSMTPQKRFWAPLTQQSQPVLLYIGANVAYRFTPEYLARYQIQHGLKQNGPEFFIDLPKGGVIQADDLMPVPNTFVSVADLAASTEVVSLMHRWNKSFSLRSAADLSMSDIRNTPAILIGGFNNTWTLETTSELPYSFRDGNRIENREDPGHGWTIPSDNRGPATEDFALISRLLRANTGGPVLAIGGIGSFGTQAVAEFVTNPEKMNELLKSAPTGWENKNMQAVLHIKVVGYAPVAVDVVATSYW